jgi:hypothetical protein
MCPIHVSVLVRCQQLCVCWQVKAHLRGDSPPLSAQQLDVVLDMANTASRELLGALPLLPCSSCLTMYHMCPRNCTVRGSRQQNPHVSPACHRLPCHRRGARRSILLAGALLCGSGARHELARRAGVLGAAGNRCTTARHGCLSVGMPSWLLGTMLTAGNSLLKWSPCCCPCCRTC